MNRLPALTIAFEEQFSTNRWWKSWLLPGSCLMFGLSISTSYAANLFGSSPNSTGMTNPIVPFTQKIDKIYISIGDVFDVSNPKENKSLYRFANSLHINTRDQTVRDLLLFKPGDVLSMPELAETERILRGESFIYDAIVRPVNIRPDKVDIQVTTRDVWTLTPGLRYSQKGGEVSSGFKLEESNFLGYGKTVNISQDRDVDRITQAYQYRDPNLLGTRHNLAVGYSDNSDGRNAEIKFSRPFYALDSTYTYGIKLITDDRVDTLSSNNATPIRFVHDEEIFEGFFGVSRPLSNGRTVRLTYGYTYDNNHFSEFNKQAFSDLPESIRENYPWIEFNYVEDRFIKAQRLDFLHRTEDINLGNNLAVRLGWSDQEFGATKNGMLVQSKYQHSAIIQKGKLLSYSFEVDGRLTHDKWENAIMSSKTRYFHTYSDYISNYVSIELEHGRHIDISDQFILGGNTGLRGYPLRYQLGDRRVLLTFEQRYYTDWHVLQLARVASVVFLDVGRAWQTGEPTIGSKRILSDVGFGLRMTLSKSSKAKVLHFDVAFPIDPSNDIDDYQVTAKSETRF